MAKRGDAAREAINKTIIEAFGSRYDGTLDKKLYVEARDGDNGELIQFAISITMPKVPVTFDTSAPGGNLEDKETAAAGSVAAPKQIDLAPDDKKKVAELMARLGLT